PTQPGKTDLREVLARGVPVVVVDQRIESPGVDRVVVDNVAATEAAVAHLAANGYERIAFIGGPPAITTAKERLLGYKRGLSAHGHPMEPQLARRGDFHESGGHAEMSALLALGTPPDAVIVANNTMTVGALQALREARKRIPRDVGVVGFDETPWASLVEPPLTTVAQPTHELGLESARLLLSRIDGFQGASREVVLRPELHPRGSSAVRRRPVRLGRP
ncbi:MAG TPA: substrate-binding domain-containing protein, partial [Acidimicrobiales bacterium]|nr:substrate-binding domain-containing protein [Acidimicrobiales bacterium]